MSSNPKVNGGSTMKIDLGQCFTPKQVAEQTGINYYALMGRINRNTVKHIKIGRFYLITKSELDKLKSEATI